MTGGLLQIVTSGKQDIYLTINPEITFFKKVFKRHTNFSLELVEINPEQPAEYNSMVSFIIKNGDAVHRCYLQIEIPYLSFSDRYVTNSNYINKKATDLNNLTINYNKWTDYYNNLKGYVEIEAELYRTLYNLLQTENITINTLKNEVSRFNFKNKIYKDKYKNKIDEKVFAQIDISGYINSINKLISDTNTNVGYISRNEIIINIERMYNNMTNNLSYYNGKKQTYYKQKIAKQSENQIQFNYSNYLGHNFFDYYNLQIGGLEIEKYSKEILHINQLHRIKEQQMPNYMEMIGNTPKLNTYNNDAKGNAKILVPLIFWFNKDAGSSLPIVAMQYSDILINAKVSDIKKIICFEDYEKMFDEIVIIELENTDGYILNTTLLYKKYKYNLDNKSIIYDCLYINDELLKIEFPDLTKSERSLILENNGTKYTLNELTQLLNPEMSTEEIELLNGPSGIDPTNNQYIIDKYQWVGFMLDINDPIYVNSSNNINIPAKVGSYYPYIDFNLYYSLIPNPKIKLIAELVYLDDVERGKFANSKLEYVVETFKDDIFDVRNQDFFDGELSFNNPCKEILWYVQPKLFLDGLTENGQNISLLFDTYKYFETNPIKSQKLLLNQYNLLFNNVNFNYYTNLLSYKFLNNILPDGVYYYSFCLYPEETQPSGTVNLREIKGKPFHIEFDKTFLSEYRNFLIKLYTKSSNNSYINKNALTLKFISKSYDLFVVHKGEARLLFSSN